MKPPIFIVGLPRTGSTLWANAFGKHPDVALFNEAYLLSVWRRDFRYVLKNKVGDLSREENVKKLIEVMFSGERSIGLKNAKYFWRQIRRLEGRELKESLYKRIMSSEDRDIGVIFKILIEEATRCQGRSRAVVKFPVYPAYLGKLVKWWPEARIVHITRDPRALAVSKTNDPGGVAKLKRRYPWTERLIPLMFRYFAILQYIWISHIHTRFKGVQNYHLFLYEELLASPDKTIHDLCNFCGLEFDESMLNPSAGQASSITGKKANGFDKGRVDAWKEVLSPRESRFIEFIVKSSMERYGVLSNIK